MLSDSRNSAPETGAVDPSYRVRLPAFQGPIGLLLSLIEERRLEVTVISLAVVTDQYLEHLRSLQEHDPAELAEFVEVAARLLVIKSRALLPGPPVEADEEDPAGSLLERLQEYRRFRQAAQWLAERLQAGLACYPREPSAEVAPIYTLAPHSPARLALAMRQLAAPSTLQPDDVAVASPSVSLASKVKLILRRVLGGAVVFFAELVQAARTRREIVATFLALLELVRRRRVQTRQEGLFAAISISKPGPAQTQTDAGQVEPAEQVC